MKDKRELLKALSDKIDRLESLDKRVAFLAEKHSTLEQDRIRRENASFKRLQDVREVRGQLQREIHQIENLLFGETV